MKSRAQLCSYFHALHTVTPDQKRAACSADRGALGYSGGAVTALHGDDTGVGFLRGEP